MMIRKFSLVLSLLAVVVLGACTGGYKDGPPKGTEVEIAQLTQGILDLGPGIDPNEASRAARISYEYTHQLAGEYQITDAPLIHNMKVNQGLRPRGLCWHWAQDLEARLNREEFQTLDLHRAIANSDSRILIDHSTAIISRKGDTMNEGMVVDPWRYGGVLFWSPLLEDTRYTWVSRMEVLTKRASERGLVFPADPSTEPLLLN